ncbi:MAG: TetR/AcrR family transcriptional regulator C-terminal domain-containing protein [Nocardioides sp.]|uniref:TetR/AcrR family transcriptional regulator C-terminal domain-containing protein n=1 Tax=Nocardioides sp. TaxID=35761 RepID=UPI0039E4F6DF
MTRNNRHDVVAQALRILDDYGLADLTMRRLAGELGVQPSALYHHFPHKQQLLGAVADELLDRRMPEWPRPTTLDWAERASAICRELREAMLAYRDGAELVSTVHAFGLGAARPGEQLAEVLLDAGLSDQTVPTATRTLLHFVFGHTLDEQTHLQAAAAGALTDQPWVDSDFELGLAIVVDGVRLRVEVAFPGSPR